MKMVITKPTFYNDKYYFGRVQVVASYNSTRDAVAAGYAITDVPVLDEDENKVPGWYLASRGREFAFVKRTGMDILAAA